MRRRETQVMIRKESAEAEATAGLALSNCAMHGPAGSVGPIPHVCDQPAPESCSAKWHRHVRCLLGACHVTGAQQVLARLAGLPGCFFLPAFPPRISLCISQSWLTGSHSWAETEVSRGDMRACDHHLLRRSLPTRGWLPGLAPSLGALPPCLAELVPAVLLPLGAAYFGLNGQFVCLLS